LFLSILIKQSIRGCLPSRTFSLFTGQWLDLSQLVGYKTRRPLSNSLLWSVRQMS